MSATDDLNLDSQTHTFYVDEDNDESLNHQQQFVDDDDDAENEDLHVLADEMTLKTS